MVSNQVISGITTGQLAILMLGPAILTGAVSIIINWLQSRTKIFELARESEYKARENLFRLYQEKLRSVKESNKSLNEGFGKIFGIYMAEEDEGERIKLLKIQLNFVKLFKELIVDSIDEFEEELRKNELFEGKNEEHVKFAKKVLSTDLGKISEDELEGIVMNYYKVLNLIDSFESTLLEKKRDELFSKYVT